MQNKTHNDYQSLYLTTVGGGIILLDAEDNHIPNKQYPKLGFDTLATCHENSMVNIMYKCLHIFAPNFLRGPNHPVEN